MAEDRLASIGWARARWWKRPNYRIKGGYILPVAGEQTTAYDPLAHRRSVTGKGKTKPPPLALWEDLRDLQTRDEGRILEFVREWGLIGCFQHRFLQLRHGALYPTNPHMPANQVEILEGLDFRALGDGGLSTGVSSPRAKVLAERPGGGYVEQPAGLYYSRYFPGLNVTGTSAYNALPPLQVPHALFEYLAEPLEEFAAEVQDFQAAARLCADAREGRIPPGETRTLPLGDGRSWEQLLPTVGELRLKQALEPHLRRIHLGLALDEEGRWSMGWRFPSLLSAGYLQLLQDLSGGHLRRCKGCLNPFRVGQRSDQAFCTPACRFRTNQRRYLAAKAAKMKEGSE